MKAKIEEKSRKIDENLRKKIEIVNKKISNELKNQNILKDDKKSDGNIFKSFNDGMYRDEMNDQNDTIVIKLSDKMNDLNSYIHEGSSEARKFERSLIFLKSSINFEF